MNERPKQLYGKALFDHIADLGRHIEAGGKWQFWASGGWTAPETGWPVFNENLWKYRKTVEPEYRYVNIYPTFVAGDYSCRLIADNSAAPGRIGCMRIPLKEHWDE